MGTFAIHTTRGIWKDWSQDEGGDLIRLAAVFACGGDDKRAVKWCLDWLGWTATASLIRARWRGCRKRRARPMPRARAEEEGAAPRRRCG
jgi:hypothetical protein